ncbi:MAG: ABC transporter ATP-binding protein, partial [Thermoleophilia bacterium]|nr:ABC transporter ATP-binding protein [Gaiellaceae bacterium]MDW8339521.1 ABC transporter ATP-binding protein [Thermoleophilia bacterium]
VERGEVFGYLGPNGAGKTTTIRLFLDLVHPTSGRVAILGLDSRSQGVEARRRVGYVPGDLRLPDRVTAAEYLDSLGRLRGLRDRTRRDELCERLDVVLDRPLRQLSRGNRQKVGIVQAFMHEPDLVVLDEPTAGLDPLLQAEVRALMRETAAAGGTIFLSSHSLDEVQHTADRVGIIRSGRLVDVDSVEGLRARSLRHVTVTLEEGVDLRELERVDGVRVIARNGATARLSAPETAMDALVKALALHTVHDLVVEPADLEEIFLELYEEADAGR